MKRKIPLWSILFVLAVFFTGYSLYQVAAKQNNTTFEFTTIAGNPSSLSPITFSTKIIQTNYPYDYWDITYDFSKGSISKTFYDRIYGVESRPIPDSSLGPFFLESTLADIPSLGVGKYYIRDYLPTLPFLFRHHILTLPEINANELFPYLQIITPASWTLEVEVDNTDRSVTFSDRFATQIEPISLNERLFFTIPTSHLHEFTDDYGNNELQYSGISGIFEINTTYGQSDQVSYDELIDCAFKVPISNTGTTDVLKLVPLEDRNSLALFLLENNKDFRLIIYQLDTEQVVTDTILTSLEETISIFQLKTMNVVIKDDTILIFYRVSSKDFEFLVYPVNENDSSIPLQKFSFSDLASQGFLFPPSSNLITEWLYHENTSYLLLTTGSTESSEPPYLLVVEGNTLKYYGQAISDINEDYTIGATFTEGFHYYQARKYKDFTIVFQQ